MWANFTINWGFLKEMEIFIRKKLKLRNSNPHLFLTQCLPWFKGLNENFCNYFFKPKANNKGFKVLKCTCKGLQESMSELEL